MSEKPSLVEIAGSDRLPARPGIGAHRPAADQRVPVHLPDRDLAGARVLPQDVGIAVLIEIAGSDRFPGRPRIGADGPAADQGVPVHFPDRGLAGARVLPQDVGKAVAVEIAGPDRSPSSARDWGVTAPPPIKLFPFISQIEAWPVLAFCHRMSEWPSLLKSPAPISVQLGPGLALTAPPPTWVLPFMSQIEA